ncbi:MAG: hypothetical protein K5675_04245 [Lachnospiraceae bacterium]|nr:hypothetical protein [Lachnospiraceae bacterium]
MKKLWNYIDNKNLKAKTKYMLAFLIVESAATLFGILLWLVFRLFGYSSGGWLFCLIGYPVMITFYVTVLYLYGHEFHNGSINIQDSL